MRSARTSLTGKEMLISFTVIGNAGVAALNQIPEGRKSAVVCKCQQPWLRPLSRHCGQELLVLSISGFDPGRVKTVFLPQKPHATRSDRRRHDRLSIFLLYRVWSQPWRNLGPRRATLTVTRAHNSTRSSRPDRSEERLDADDVHHAREVAVTLPLASAAWSLATGPYGHAPTLDTGKAAFRVEYERWQREAGKAT